MDGSQFDRFTKSVAGTSRRALLGTALSATFAAVGVRTTLAGQVLRKSGEVCRKNGDCASGICGSKDATGRQRCSCSTGSDCPAPTPDGSCNGPICINGVCGVGLTAGGPCNDQNHCTTNDTCTSVQGEIVCMGTPVNCAPPDACHVGACNPIDGSCRPPGPENELPDGTNCGGDNVCTGGVCGAVICVGTFQDYGESESAACTSSSECCQDEPTNCEVVASCGNGPQCCHPQGGSCSNVVCDCCNGLACNDGICGPPIG